MYIPDAFKAESLAWAHKLMSTHSFATLVSEGKSGLTASHLPLLYSNKGGGKWTMIPDVVAFEIPIARFQAKAKLSQNRPNPDRPRIIEELKDSKIARERALGAFMDKENT